jgi:hydrogenase/urease accessory protein HupE
MTRYSAIILLAATVTQAHEIGTSRVSVQLSGGEYSIELITDAAALREKLAAVGGSTARVDNSKFEAFDNVFRRRVQLAFDGVDVHPVIEYKLAGAMAEIRLKGSIPPGAKQLTWNYGWTFASYSLTAGGATEWLEGNQTSKPIPVGSPAPSDGPTALRYLLLGFTHIVPKGLDHMLFVLGIYLLSGRARTVLSQVSAFTVAHSITLGLSMYGLVSVPAKIVEPAIAISIAYVAIENIFLKQLKSWRVALVFAFGLLHGMGFAGALKEVGLPRSEFLTALLTFNIGVEAGQLAVIAAAFLVLGWHFADRSWYRSRVVVPASAMIACTAVYWTVQRLVA